MLEHERKILDQIQILRRPDWAEPFSSSSRRKASASRFELSFDEVPFELILPIGSPQAFAQDSSGSVIGLKLGGVGANGSEIVDLICELKALRRLVLYSKENLSISDRLADLPLELVWLGGKLARIPQRLFYKELPLVVAEEKNTGVIRQVLSRATYEIVARNSVGSKDELPISIREASSGTLKVRVRSRERAAQDHPNYQHALEELLQLRGVMISAQAVSDPPFEILAKGQNALLSYYAETESESHPVNELKVIVVGNGGAGKTSLVKRLMGEKFDKTEKQTHGINIKQHSISTEAGADIKINYWDFGGQEIMHATHQFFLSKRSVYILVLDGRKDEDPEYWLQHIESFGGDSPIFVVLNKVDENSAYDVNRRFLFAKYKGIVDFHRISCSKQTGISELLAQLRERLPTFPMLQTKWPRAWFDVKAALEKRGQPFITLDGYRACCVRYGVSASENQELLVDFLHDLGIVLHFRDLQLLDTHVLDPRWVTEGVYRIINSSALATRRGVLPLDQIGDVLKRRGGQAFEYPAEKHAFLVDLMLKFELCYRVDQSTILVPDLLDVQEPPIEFDGAQALSFVFEFAYLPKSVMPRFIVRMHADIVDGRRWRTGVLLHDGKFDAVALVRADDNAKRIYVDVTGAQNRDFFSVVRKALNDIIGSFEKLVVKELVPLPDHADILVEYQELLGHEKSGRTEYFAGKVGAAYDVKALLNGFESPVDRLAEKVINIEGNYYAGATTVNNTLSPPSTQQPQRELKMTHQPATWERVVVYGAGIAFLLLLGFLLVRNTPIADPNLVVALRVVLSLVTAVFGATIPGLLHVGFSGGGLVIRAVGALGLFVLAFMVTPQVLPNAVN